MKQHKKLRINLVFAAVILAAAAVLLLVRKANQTGAPLCAEAGTAVAKKERSEASQGSRPFSILTPRIIEMRPPVASTIGPFA